MQEQEVYYDDEIDLREIALTLLKGWKIILLTTVLVGASAFGYSKTQTPVYETNATLSLNATTLSLDTNPVNLLSSDKVRQAVADNLEVPITSLPTPVITQDKTDKTLFTLTIQSPSPEEATRVANTWADIGLDIIKQQLEETSNNVDSAILSIEEKDQALVSYLRQHGLNNWTWADLAALTGISNSPSIVTQTKTQELPAISDEERLEIFQLMQARITAEQSYKFVFDKFTELEYVAEINPPAVLNYAITPVKPTSPKTLMNTALGLVLGGMLGVFWVFAAGWWQGSDEDESDGKDKQDIRKI